MKKKKILAISTFYFPHVGGVETYSQGLFLHLTKKDPNIELTIIALNTDHAPAVEKKEGMIIYRIPTLAWPSINPVFSLRTLNSILKKIEVSNFDLVITQCRYYFLTYYMSYLARKYCVPLLHIEHNSGYMKNDSKIIESVAWLYDKFVSPKVFQRANRIICVSSSVSKFIKSAFKFSLEKKICIITSGINEKKWLEVTHYHDSKKFPLIFFGGRLIREKGIYLLLSCVENLRHDYPNLCLYIAGTGPEEARIKKIISSCDLKNNVKMLGGLTHEEMINIFKRTDVYANPSFYSEGLQISLIEAACAGLPIVSTNVGGAEEVVQHGVSGLIVNQKDPKEFEQSLRRILENGEERMNFGKKARENAVKKFAWKKIIDEFYAFALQ